MVAVVWAADQPNTKANIKAEEAECDARQIRLFHKLVGFKKLGLVFRNDLTGKSGIEKLAEEKGIELVSCYISPEEIGSERITECIQRLVNTADAIYISRTALTNPKNIPEMVRLANDRSIPTFLQDGSEYVKYGFLMGLSVKCSTVAQTTPKIAINVKTAEIIRYNPPLDVLRMADKIYQNIENP